MNIVTYSFLYSIVKYEKPLESDAKTLLAHKIAEMSYQRMTEAAKA